MKQSKIRRIDRFTLAYELFSFLSGLVELGMVVLALRSQLPFVYVLLVALAYQVGALLREPVELTVTQYRLAALLAMLTAFTAQLSPVALVAVTLFLSVALQGGRGIFAEQQHDRVSTFMKRVFRVAGFALAGFMSYALLLVVAVTVFGVMVALTWKAQSNPTMRLRNLNPSRLSWVMFVHQTHYFSYAYIILALMVTKYQVSTQMAGPLFCLGWVSYVLSQRLLDRYRLVPTFVLGHMWAAATLALLYFFRNEGLAVFLLFWFLSGFGGGTEFCLRKLKSQMPSDHSDLESWGNLGHVVGVVVCMLVLGVTAAPALAFVSASCLATATFLLFILVQRGFRMSATQEAPSAVQNDPGSPAR